MSQYYLDIQNLTEDSNNFIVQGVATGTVWDEENERMSVQVLRKFAEKINKEGMAITNGHQIGGAVDDDLGGLTFAEVLTDNPVQGQASLFVKGYLDGDNPNNQYLHKKINKGKHFAFSIEADGIYNFLKSRTGERMKEFVDAEPKIVTITTKPSYAPSFLEVIQKSYMGAVDQTKYTDYPDGNFEELEGIIPDNVTKCAGRIRARQPIPRSEVGLLASLSRDERLVKAVGGAQLVEWAKDKLREIEASIIKSTDLSNNVAQIEDEQVNLNINQSNMQEKEIKTETEATNEPEVKADVALEETQETETQSNETKVETEAEASEAEVEVSTEVETEVAAEVEAEVTAETEVEAESETEEIEKTYEKRIASGQSDQGLEKIFKSFDARLSAIEDSIGSSIEKSFQKPLGQVGEILKSMHEDLEALKSAPLKRKAIVKSSDISTEKAVDERSSALRRLLAGELN